MTEFKNSIEEVNDRLDKTEERISKLEDSAVEFMQSGKKRKKVMKKSENSLRDLQKTHKKISTYTL